MENVPIFRMTVGSLTGTNLEKGAGYTAKAIAGQAGAAAARNRKLEKPQNLVKWEGRARINSAWMITFRVEVLGTTIGLHE
jgi:hypothetical protein